MASRINKNKVIAAAQKCVQKGQYDRAIREYHKVVDEDPRDVRIWLKIGDLYAKKGAAEEAIQTYLKVADFYSEQGFYLKAVAVYKQVLKLNPSLVEINLKLAGLYKQLGLLNDAMQQYELVSNYYHQQGRTKDALAAVRQIVDLDPENIASRIKLAELYSKEQMREEAVEEFSKAADFLRAGNRLDDFIKVAERLIFHQPENLAVTRELASLYLRRKDPRRALQKLQLAFKADPRDDSTLGMLAQAFEDLGQIAKTVSVLRELAHIYAENGDEPKRLETYQRILTLAPDDEEAKRALQGDAAEPRALQGNAVEPQFQKVAARPPPPPPPPPARSIDDGGFSAPSTISDTDPDERPTSAFRQRPMPPPRPGAEADLAEETARVLTEAEVYIKYGLHEKAIDHLRTVFHHDPDNVEVRLKLRDLFLQIGRFAEAAQELYMLARGIAGADRRQAAQYLNEALELDGGNEAARQLLGQLEQSAVEGVGHREPVPVYEEEQYTEEAYPPRFRDDTYNEDYEDSSAIALDVDDIVEEIPIEAEDLLEAEDLELPPPRNRLDSVDAIPPPTIREFADQRRGGSGILEVRGEMIDTLGGGTPAAEVIELPATDPGELRARLQEEEPETSVEDDLEEADFFIQQNLFGEARAILDDLLNRVPNNPLVRAKLADLEEFEQRASAAIEASQASEQDEHSDLAADLASELDASVGDMLPTADEDFSVEDVFNEFKRSVDDQISDEDSDTHYDLGIAYREMGLMDDAINEFKVAMRSRDKEVLCHMMIGLCQAEKGLMSEAISQFKTGLYVEGITERETIALYFELGQAYEQLDDLREALYYYEKVNKKDPKFRDVASRIERLRQTSGGNGATGSGGGGGIAQGGGGQAPSASLRSPEMERREV